MHKAILYVKVAYDILLCKAKQKKNLCLKGVLHPRPVFWLFMHFSQKLQHIGNK